MCRCEIRLGRQDQVRFETVDVASQNFAGESSHFLVVNSLFRSIAIAMLKPIAHI